MDNEIIVLMKECLSALNSVPNTKLNLSEIKDTYALASKLEKTLKSVVELNKNQIEIKWHVDDVIAQAKENIENGAKYPVPTKEQARDILKIVKNNHDCNYGITWDHITDAIEIIFDDLEREKSQI